MGKNPDYSVKGYQKPEFNVLKGNGMNLGGELGLWVSNNVDFEILESPFQAKEIETQSLILPGKKTLYINVLMYIGLMGAPHSLFLV